MYEIKLVKHSLWFEIYQIENLSRWYLRRLDKLNISNNNLDEIHKKKKISKIIILYETNSTKKFQFDS